MDNQEVSTSKQEDAETVIKFYWDWIYTGIYAGYKFVPQTGKASLENFMKHFDKSKEANSPFDYTRFLLLDFKVSVFNDPNWIKFISVFGRNIKSLRLSCEIRIRDTEETALEGKLRYLIWDQLPNLQEFELEGGHFGDRDSYEPQPNNGQVQLPRLKILYLDQCACLSFPGIITDILGAAVNLEKIELSKADTPSQFRRTSRFFQSLGKLHLVQNGQMEILEYLERFEDPPLDFKFNKLELFMVPVLRRENSWLPASFNLSNVFESIKDTLTELTTGPLGILPRLRLPKFSKLISLKFYQLHGEKINAFPTGAKLMETFPVLQCLDLKGPWTELFPHDEPFSFFPNLKTLKITGEEMTKVVIARISFLCPNLKELLITGGQSGSLKNFPEVGSAIWTHMKQLESLDMEIDLDSEQNTFLAIDSSITGFSNEDCGRLYALIQAEKLIDKWSFQATISQAELEADRKYPSILDLKDLRNLTLNLISRDWNAAPEPGSDLFKKTLTVSEKHAFQLMDKLTVKKNQIKY